MKPDTFSLKLRGLAFNDADVCAGGNPLRSLAAFSCLAMAWWRCCVAPWHLEVLAKDQRILIVRCSVQVGVPKGHRPFPDVWPWPGGAAVPAGRHPCLLVQHHRQDRLPQDHDRRGRGCSRSRGPQTSSQGWPPGMSLYPGMPLSTGPCHGCFRMSAFAEPISRSFGPMARRATRESPVGLDDLSAARQRSLA